MALGHTFQTKIPILNTHVHLQIKKRLFHIRIITYYVLQEKYTISDVSDLVSYPKRGKHSALAHVRYTSSNVPTNEEDTKPDHQSISNIDNQVVAYFTTMKNCTDGINNAEYLNIAHEQLKANKTIEKNQDTQINLSDFIPEPRSLTQVLKLSPIIREKWRLYIKNIFYYYLTMILLTLLKEPFLLIK